MKLLMLFLTLTCLTLGACTSKNDVDTTASIHMEIEVAYPELGHVTGEYLEERLKSAPEAYLILDTRPAAEYNVSHIKSAIRVSPDISPKDFQSRFGTQTRNKSVILYCSVGWRSSKAAHGLKTAAIAAGALDVKNLKGGLFEWHNSKRPMVNQAGPTRAIHPYNERWGGLITKEADKSYTPR